MQTAIRNHTVHQHGYLHRAFKDTGTFVFVTSCKKITIITIITITTTYNADHCLLFAVPEGNICNALFRIMYLTKCI